VDHRTEAREFLVSRRAKITPAQANLPAGTNRRVPGLRRSEVAALAGVSVEYYAKLERGALAGVSAGVLDAIACALQLDDAERAHLFDLAQAADGSSALVRPRRRAAKPWSPRPSLQWTLDAVTDGPAFVRNGRMDLLAANRLARVFYADVYADPQQPPTSPGSPSSTSAPAGSTRTGTSSPTSPWPSCAPRPAATPTTRTSRTWWGSLSTRSDEFRRRWGAHNVRHHGSGAKTYQHPIVGELTLAYEGLELAAEPGLTLTIYTAEPGSPSEEALRLLASWASTPDQAPAVPSDFNT
jgi:transcriptional regulator with XRE-family HTH domain